jgi:hypothetical protein
MSNGTGGSAFTQSMLGNLKWNTLRNRNMFTHGGIRRRSQKVVPRLQLNVNAILHHLNKDMGAAESSYRGSACGTIENYKSTIARFRYDGGIAQQVGVQYSGLQTLYTIWICLFVKQHVAKINNAYVQMSRVNTGCCHIQTS